MRRAVVTHLRANAVAYVALFFAVGGGVGYAAGALPRNSVGTAQLKRSAVTASKLHAGAVTASRVARDALTGKQIKESSLGTVPQAARAARADAAGTADHAAAADRATDSGHAASADSATNAGHATSADSATNGARRIDFVSAPTDTAPASNAPGAHAVLTAGGMSLNASCIDAGSGQARLYVTATSSVAGELSVDFIRFDNPGVTPRDSGATLPAGGTFLITDITGGNRHEGGVVVYRNASTTVTLNLHDGAEDYDTNRCEAEGTALVATS